MKISFFTTKLSSLWLLAALLVAQCQSQEGETSPSSFSLQQEQPQQQQHHEKKTDDARQLMMTKSKSSSSSNMMMKRMPMSKGVAKGWTKGTKGKKKTMAASSLSSYSKKWMMKIKKSMMSYYRFYRHSMNMKSIFRGRKSKGKGYYHYFNRGKGYVAKGRPPRFPTPPSPPTPSPPTPTLPPPTTRSPVVVPATGAPITNAPTMGSSMLNPFGTWTLVGQTLEFEFSYDSTFSGEVPVDMSADGSRWVANVLNNDGANNGFVYVYELDASANEWIQLGQDIPVLARDVSMSADGNRIAITSANNFVRIYVYDDSTTFSWVPLGADISAAARWNWPVALSADGTTVIVGGTVGESGASFNSGPIRAYRYGGTVLTQVGQDIVFNRDAFNGAVDISADGSIIALGFPFTGDNDTPTNYARVFIYDSSTDLWTQRGQDIVGGPFDGVGRAVALSSDGNTLVVGANGAGDRGQAQVFQYEDSTEEWIQLGPFIDGVEMNTFDVGANVATSSDGRVVAYAPYANGARPEGHIAVFQYNDSPGSSQWSQIGRTLLQGDTVNLSPYFLNVALSSTGETLVMTSIETDDIDGDFVGYGRVRVFEYS